MRHVGNHLQDVELDVFLAYATGRKFFAANRQDLVIRAVPPVHYGVNAGDRHQMSGLIGAAIPLDRG